ncbi:Fpg/Nei family DNA glycosylase [Streptomyces noboritoensis]|uniref:DNA-(apurinic or apyrimidinic site) lyase n=1 Tax=Streptomyces noboritoensis TaxID=67337 RepID=A0ABV6TMN5_9ACTN
MPEGDTVWQAARRLDDALGGRELIRSDLRVPRLATVDLTGRTVLDVTPRGKHLLTRIEGGLTLHSHLRMEGSWRIFAPGERWRGGRSDQIRAILGTADRTAVGYRLAVLELLRTRDEHRVVGHLGPDLLGPDWDPDLALRNLLRHPARPLGEALLDQRNLAGVGNIYKSEICFAVRAVPWLPVGELTDPARVVVAAKKILEANRERTSRKVYVYGRSGQPCPRCGTALRATTLRDPAGSERPTYWCPRCQPNPPAGNHPQGQSS